MRFSINIIASFWFIIIVVVTQFKTSATASIDTKLVELVLNRLDDYSSGKKTCSQLSINDLRAAGDQFMSWPEDVRVSMMEDNPKLKLLNHFGFIPMKRFFILSVTDDSSSNQNFVTRLEKYYKQFRPAYYGKMIGTDYRTLVKLDALCKSFLEMNDFKPLTMSMYKAAMLEYEAIQKRIEEIPEFEDIYSSADEYRTLQNSINIGTIRLLVKKFIPLMKANPPRDEADLQKWKTAYRDEFSKLTDYKIQNGRLVMIASA